jgi:hypothetical protein
LDEAVRGGTEDPAEHYVRWDHRVSGDFTVVTVISHREDH